MSSTVPFDHPRELAHRVNDGLDVVLLWFERTNRVLVSVIDAKTGDRFQLSPAVENALDAFYHPYAYAAAQGICYQRPGRQLQPTPVYA